MAYSKEVREMIEKIPTVVAGLGMTIIIVITILIISLNFIIKKPIILPLPMTVSMYVAQDSYNDIVAIHISTNLKLFTEIKTGQKISMKLNDYPSLEYGVIQGVISDVNQIDDIISVKLEKGWETSNDKKITPTDNLYGTIDIIIKEEPMFDQLFLRFTKK